jgi:hypothetical protein
MKRGPVATELRACWPAYRIALTHMSDETWSVVADATGSLRIHFPEDMQTYWADILSEAIEAADALNL